MLFATKPTGVREVAAMEDRIEHRIAIRATLDRVWSLITRPGWWLPASAADPAGGAGRVAVEWGRERTPWVIDIVRVEPQGYVSFRWASSFAGAAPVPGNSTLVEFYVRPVGDEIGVTVVESGFTALDLPEALREDQLTANTGGWQYDMAALRTRAEQLESPQNGR
jgi:uncharacterized protein YndB with AHSA1/START domain